MIASLAFGTIACTWWGIIKPPTYEAQNEKKLS